MAKPISFGASCTARRWVSQNSTHPTAPEFGEARRIDGRLEDVMQDPSDGGFSRRTMLAGAAAGALALTSNPAAAQRCAGPPPPHQKGSRVWLDLDQKELDDA